MGIIESLYGIPDKQTKDNKNYDILAESINGLNPVEARKLRVKHREKCILDMIEPCRFITKTYNGKKYIYKNVGVNQIGGFEPGVSEFYDNPNNVKFLEERKENYIKNKKIREENRKKATSVINKIESEKKIQEKFSKLSELASSIKKFEQ